ncbi:MAG: YihY/virulence factor BrkB family protein [Proteobacteria bacterium]|nr:YihY/virulence factor BrkB family protein [Pseudomonadota bacterium]
MPWHQALSPREAWTITRQAAEAWLDDRCTSLGAALSYYTLFSMAPLLLIVVSVAGLLFGADAARGEVAAQLEGLLGGPGAAAVQELLASVNWPAGSALATVTGLVLMLIGATTVFAELQGTLDHIWRAPAQPLGGWWAFFRARVLSFGLILGVGFLLIVSLLASAAMAALRTWWLPYVADWQVVVDLIGSIFDFALVTVLFALIYKLMPRVRIAWSDVWVGAVVTAALFAVGRQLIGLYIGRGAVGSGFGAAGSLVAVLVWVYYSAQIFLFGAEFTWVFAHRVGSRRDSAPAATTATPAPRS